MSKIKKRISALVVLALIVGVTATITACGTGDSGQATIDTVYVLSPSKKVDLDPAKSQNLNITTLGLLTRRLTSWNVPQDGSEVTVGADLATDTGTASNGGKTWTYHIKNSIKFEDGSPVTAKDIKWGIERSFADELTGGLSLHKNLLVGGADYKGPFGGQELDSIEVPDDFTIIFQLLRPFGDWPWIVSTPAFSPVPHGNTNTSTYGEHPIATGPYKVATYETGVKLEFEKNPYWDSATDNFRSGTASKIVTLLNQSADTATDRLIADSGDDQFAFASSFVAPSKLAEISNQPDVAKRLVTSSPGAVQYLALNTARAPLDNKDLRIALQYAVDKKSVQLARGGEIGGGIATTLITPGIPGREDYDLYPTNPSGDVDKAKQILKSADIDPTSLTLKLLAVSTTQSLAVAQAIAQGIERTGIKVSIQQVDEDSAFDIATAGLSADYDLYVSSWQPDIPSADSNIEPLYASDQIGNGNYNLAHYNNPAVDAKIKAAQEETDPKRAEKLWAQLDKEILADAPVVPLVYTKNTWLIGSKLKDFYIGSFPAYPNYLRIGVEQ